MYDKDIIMLQVPIYITSDSYTLTLLLRFLIKRENIVIIFKFIKFFSLLKYSIIEMKEYYIIFYRPNISSFNTLEPWCCISFIDWCIFDGSQQILVISTSEVWTCWCFQQDHIHNRPSKYHKLICESIPKEILTILIIFKIFILYMSLKITDTYNIHM